MIRWTAEELISIHAPLAGRDVIELAQLSRPEHFNPRAPCGARRQCAQRDAICWRLKGMDYEDLMAQGV